MARKTCYQQGYLCPKCNKHQKHYTWTDEIMTKTHNCETTGCDHILTVDDTFDEEVPSTPLIIGRKMNQQEIKADRKKRSQQDFEKNTLPYLAPEDKRFFKGKGYKEK